MDLQAPSEVTAPWCRTGSTGSIEWSVQCAGEVQADDATLQLAVDRKTQVHERVKWPDRGRSLLPVAIDLGRTCDVPPIDPV